MKQFNKTFLTFLFVFAACFSSMAQNRFFTDAYESQIPKANINRVIIPLKSKLVALDEAGMKAFLWSLPSEKNIIYKKNQTPVLELPMPDGKTAKFHVWESSIQEPGLEAKFPEIRTFTGQGIDDPHATIRFDITPRGFHAQVLSTNGTWYIDPYAMNDTKHYNSYFRVDQAPKPRFICNFENEIQEAGRIVNVAAACRGTELRTYRLAVACTGEYAQAPGVAAGTNAALLHAAIVTTVNRVVGVYEKEVALRMVLVANNNLIEYLVASTDPFTGNNNANTLINESQTVITTNIGSANYDIGHTFSTGGGGLAGLGVVCSSGSKARGITGSPQPTGDAYDIDYVAHEMGHQWGGNHSMAGCGGSPNTTKYEVGSGTTIQAYAGICGSQDIQLNSDPTFHAISFDEISNYIAGTGGTCGVLTATGNTLPVIAALPAGFSIPVGTPFTLTGSATDADGDALSYCWEQWDLGGTVNWNAGATAPAGNTVPLFKSRLPKVTGSRSFPDPRVIIAGFPANPAPTLDGLKGETLSPVARPMKFRLSVRDNRAGGGGVVSAGAGGCQSNTPFTVTAVGTTPFVVTVPNGGESYAGGSTQTVTWNVSGTDAAPISTANVKISLSTDGGLTFPTVITASTANDGSEALSMPSVATTTARIKVEAINNIFYDISNQNFTLTAASNGFTFNSVAPTSVACGAASAVATLGTAVQGSFSTAINLTASGNPAGTTVTFGTNPLSPGNSTTVTLNNVNTLAPGTYDITVNGLAGAVSQSGVVSFVVQPGTPPAITTQPAGATVCEGESATFTVASSAAGVTYQWQVSTGAAFTNIPGATAASYVLTGATAAQDGDQYQVVLTTLCGTSTSTPATLTINAATAITNQPAPAVICAGNNNTFTVSAVGSGLTYQWQVSPTGCGGPFLNIPGANAASYTLTAITLAQNGYAYQVVVTGACLPATITSTCALLSVSGSVGITAQPVSSTVCSGSDATFTITASGSGVNYQWQQSTGGPFTDIAGATTATLTIPAVTSALDGNQYQVVLTNPTCTTPSTSSVVTLTVNELPAVTTQPVSATVCAGSNVTFTSAATGTGISYQWQMSVAGGPFTDIVGAISASYTENAVTAAMNNNQYHVTVSGTCTPAAVSSNATLTVISPAGITTQPSVSGASCAGSDVTLTVTASTGGAPTVIYQWQVSTDGVTFNDIPGATAATLVLTAVTPALDGNLYQVIVSNATCAATTTSSPVTLTVNALPTVSATADATSVCTGTAVVLSATGASTYVWEPGTISGSTVTVNPAVNPATPGQSNTIDYTVIGTDINGCTNSAIVTVTANPLPAVTLTATPPITSLVAGQSVLLKANVNPSGIFVYTWTKDGVVIPNTTDSLRVTANDAGSYAVTAADASGTCGNTSDAIAIRDSATVKFYIYPNPNNGQFIVSYHNPGGLSVGRNVTVYDNKGARVYSKVLAINQPYQLINVDLKVASSSVYIIVLYDASGNRLATERVVVQR